MSTQSPTARRQSLKKNNSLNKDIKLRTTAEKHEPKIREWKPVGRSKLPLHESHHSLESNDYEYKTMVLPKNMVLPPIKVNKVKNLTSPASKTTLREQSQKRWRFKKSSITSRNNIKLQIG